MDHSSELAIKFIFSQPFKKLYLKISKNLNQVYRFKKASFHRISATWNCCMGANRVFFFSFQAQVQWKRIVLWLVCIPQFPFSSCLEVCHTWDQASFGKVRKSCSHITSFCIGTNDFTWCCRVILFILFKTLAHFPLFRLRQK